MPLKQSKNVHVWLVAGLAFVSGLLVALLVFNVAWNNPTLSQVVSPTYLMMSNCTMGVSPKTCLTANGQVYDCVAFAQNSKLASQASSESSTISRLNAPSHSCSSEMASFAGK